MSRKKSNVIFWACDFETTVWGDVIERQKGVKQDHTEVWSAASVKLYDDTETVIVDHSIRDFLARFLNSVTNDILYFHNLSFDGSFIVDFLLREGYKFTNERDKDMPNKTFRTSISQMGAWYFIKIKKGHKLLEIRNSLKLIPSSLKRIAQSFKTKHQKLDMVYEGDRHAYCEITEEELKYIENDVLVLKEALEKMFDEGHDKLTIGSCCLAEFKEAFTTKEYKSYFPDLRDYPCNSECSNVWEYVHKSYHGGWCYVNPVYAHQIIEEGTVYDVNSLYPSMMHSMSGNRYPVGKPTKFSGEPPEDITRDEKYYYFIRFRCRFSLKPRCLPWIHIRKSNLYKSNENLTTSDVRKKGKYSRYYLDDEGYIQDTKVELTLTCKDWDLFKETYYIYDLEILDGCYFRTVIGIFDEYINYYKELKMKSKGFQREMAKLFLNNLYGKMAMNDDSSYKEPYLDADTDVVKFITHNENKKQVGYIPIGSAITSYAMNFTIRAAMENYDRFCYADTDSIHLKGYEAAKGVTVHPTEFCCWDNELKFNVGYYERQKVYAENAIEKGGTPCKPTLLLKCAGMSQSAKDQFISLGLPINKLSVGLELEDSNLKATRVKGGIVLRKSPFKLRKALDKNVKIPYN